MSVSISRSMISTSDSGSGYPLTHYWAQLRLQPVAGKDRVLCSYNRAADNNRAFHFAHLIQVPENV